MPAKTPPPDGRRTYRQREAAARAVIEATRPWKDTEIDDLDPETLNAGCAAIEVRWAWDDDLVDVEVTPAFLRELQKNDHRIDGYRVYLTNPSRT